jgi:hypothetical protein
MRASCPAHLNGVLHKSLPSFCVSVRLFTNVASQRLGKNFTAAMNTEPKIGELWDA